MRQEKSVKWCSTKHKSSGLHWEVEDRCSPETVWFPHHRQPLSLLKGLQHCPTGGYLVWLPCHGWSLPTLPGFQDCLAGHHPQSHTEQGLSPCMAKYPPVVCLLKVNMEVLLSVFVAFVVLGLVNSYSKSAHPVWLPRDQWYRGYNTFWTFAVTLTWNTVTKFLHRTLQLMMLY